MKYSYLSLIYARTVPAVKKPGALRQIAFLQNPADLLHKFVFESMKRGAVSFFNLA